MLPKAVEEGLNKQVAMEAFASQNYLAMACWCDNNALEGCAAFLYHHAEEERMHMMKLVRYINESGGFAIIPAIAQPNLTYENVQQLFESAYQHELKVSKSIDELVDLSDLEKDRQTSTFLQWYVDEQHEEEALYRTLLDKVKLIGIEGRGLYFIDKEVQVLLDIVEAKEAAEG